MVSCSDNRLKFIPFCGMSHLCNTNMNTVPDNPCNLICMTNGILVFLYYDTQIFNLIQNIYIFPIDIKALYAIQSPNTYHTF